MKTSTLYVKNMVCNRCILVVGQELDQRNIKYATISLGEVVLTEAPTDHQLTAFKSRLTELGFELLDDTKQKLIDKIKTVVIEDVHHNSLKEAYNFSEILSSKLNRDYTYLSKLFSDVEGITIEKYIINQKIEKVKELLIYDELNLSEIAFRLGYSSVSHLSNQFKKTTGLTPSHFKNVGGNRRQPIDGL